MIKNDQNSLGLGSKRVANQGSKYFRFGIKIPARANLSRTTKIAVSPQRPNSGTGELTTPGIKEREENASDQGHDHAVLAVELLHESISREWNARDLLFKADIPPGRW